ncbi:MAG: hypothetical protein ACLQVD_05490 [Capsulimonadaceae bacterium]
MQTQILEGTFADIQKIMFTLPFKPETRLRVTVTEPELAAESEDLHFENAARRNGLILFPTHNRSQTITTEFINRLIEEE